MNKRQRVTIDLSMEEDEEEEAFSEPVLSPSSNTNPPLQRRSSSPSSNASASTLHTPRKVPANLFSYFKPSPASTSSPSPPAVPRTKEVKIEPSVAKLLPILPSQRSTPRSLVLKSGFKCSSTEFFSSLLQRRETASSAYHRHFLSMFEAVFNSLPFYHHLFDEKEFDLCRSVLSSSPKLQALLSRLVMRKGPWFQVTSCMKYYEVAGGSYSPESPPSEEEMETTIQEVIELGLKEHLLEVPWNSGKPEHENSRILQVLECCARARDVKAIAKVVLNLDAKKTTTTKKDSLIALRRKALTGRTLFGGTIRLLPPAKKALYSQDKHTIFRVSLDLQNLYNRVHSLYYLVTNTSSLSSGASSWAADSASSGSVWGMGGSSGATYSPGLMAIFNKVKFTPVTLSQSTVPFPTRTHLIAFEYSLELRNLSAASIGSAAEALRGQEKEESARSPDPSGDMSRTPPLHPLVLLDFLQQWLDRGHTMESLVLYLPPSLSTLADASLSFCHSIFQSTVWRSAPPKAQETDPGSDSNSDAPLTRMGNILSTVGFTASESFDVSRFIEQLRNTDFMGLPPEHSDTSKLRATLVALASTVWLAFDHQFGLCAAALLEGTEKIKSPEKLFDTLPELKSLLPRGPRLTSDQTIAHQVTAGWILSTTLWQEIAALEGCGEYANAIDAVVMLLHMGLTQHRIGRCLARLVIDLCHMKEDVAGGVVCQLLDRFEVDPGERAAMLRRKQRLMKGHGERVMQQMNKLLSLERLSSRGPQPAPQDRGSMANDLFIGAGRTPFAAVLAGLATSLNPTDTPRSGDSVSKEVEADEEEGVPCDIVIIPWTSRDVKTFKLQQRPLNREVGVKSRFLGADIFNDSSQLPSFTQEEREEAGYANVFSQEIECLVSGSVVMPVSPGRASNSPPFPARGVPDSSSLRFKNISSLFQAWITAETAQGSPTTTAGAGTAQEMFDAMLDNDGPDYTVSVEMLAIQHYESADHGGWVGVHCEGRPIYPLFSLLMWDVLFMNSPDAFWTPFQDAPLDLDFTPDFYVQRKEAIQQRLSEVCTMTREALCAAILESYEAHFGQTCRGMSWTTSCRTLQLIAVCLGGPALAHIFDAMAWNHKYFTGGLPDLLLWRVVVPSASFVDAADVLRNAESSRLPLLPAASYECKLVEVKGPRDVLSEKQREWLKILSSGGMRVELCKIQE